MTMRKKTILSIIALVLVAMALLVMSKVRSTRQPPLASKRPDDDIKRRIDLTQLDAEFAYAASLAGKSEFQAAADHLDRVAAAIDSVLPSQSASSEPQLVWTCDFQELQ